MLYEIISLVFGIIKILIFKIIYPFRISFKSIPKINSNFKIAIKRKSKIIFGFGFRARNNVSFRVYNNGKISIGNNCFMNDNCSINCQAKVTIGDNVIMGQNVMIFDHDHDYKNNINDFVREEVKIGNNVWIGANVVILKGVTIGDNCVIAAGTLINKDIESNIIVLEEKNKIKRDINYEKY